MVRFMLLAFLYCFLINNNAYSKELYRDPLDNMPIMERLPIEYRGAIPIEQREEEFRRFLAASVKIQANDGIGSGSIIYYDKEKNLAYVASCGHLWNKGVLSEKDAKIKNVKCKIIVWYKNDIKLDKPESFDASLLFYSYTDLIDTSLLVFSPDWTPKYFPIAPENYKYKIGSMAHSCGCDGAREVAHYEVEILEENDDLVTSRNSPRPGRSGGGLFDENFYIGTCWGTERIDGSGRGFFTPIKDIHSFWGKQKTYSFLLEQKTESLLGRLIPIVDKRSKQKNYDQNYILIP